MHTNLSGVGRIGQYFLVAGHAGIEDHFSAGAALAGKSVARKNRAVFKGQDGFHASLRKR